MSSDYIELYVIDRKPKMPAAQKAIYLIAVLALIVIFATA